MREIRTRQGELARRLAGLGLDGRNGRRVMLGQVYDGGAIPTSGSDRVYLTHPVELDGSESEGSAGTAAADTTRSVPVVVLGSAIPAVGDVLIAYSVGGRWVAERGSGAASISCFPCGIPGKNLTLTWGGDFPGSATLVWNGLTGPGTAAWTATGITFGGYSPTTVLLRCISGISQLDIATSDLNCRLVRQSFTCSPFHQQYTTVGGTTSPPSSICDQYSVSGVSPVYIDG